MKSIIFLCYCCLALLGCSSYQLLTHATAEYYVISPATDTLASTPLTERIERLVEPYQTELDSRMNEVIGRAARAMPKGQPESALGNWIADALQAKALQLSTHKVHASVQNYGGIRIAELPAGAITVGTIYELMPFDNTLVIVELSAPMAQHFFDHIAAKGGWPVSKEVQFTIRKGKAVDLQIQGQPLEPDATYYLAMPDYIANGGDDCGFLRDLPREETGVLIRDILIQQVKATTYNNSYTQAFLSGRILKGD